MFPPKIDCELTHEQNNHIRSFMKKKEITFDDFKSILKYSPLQLELFNVRNPEFMSDKSILYNILHEFLSTKTKNLTIDYQVFLYLTNTIYYFPTHVIEHFFVMKKFHEEGNYLSLILYIIKFNLYWNFEVFFAKDSAYYNLCLTILKVIHVVRENPIILKYNQHQERPDLGFIFWVIDETHCAVQVNDLVYKNYELFFEDIDFEEDFELLAKLSDIIGLRYFKKDFKFTYDECLSTKNFVFQVVDQITNAKIPEIVPQILYFLEYICVATDYHKYTNVHSALYLFFHTEYNKKVIPLLKQIDENIYYKLLIFFDDKSKLTTNIKEYTDFLKEIKSVTADFIYDNEAESYDYLIEIAKFSSINYLIEQYKNKEMDSVLSILELFPELVKYGEYFIDFREEMIQVLEKIRDTENYFKVSDKSLEQIKNMKFLSKQFLVCFNFLWNILPHDFVLKYQNKDSSEELSLSTIYSQINKLDSNKKNKKFLRNVERSS